MEEMNDLFYQDAYLSMFQSKVIACEKYEDGYVVVLEDTVFYPEGGGQPSDQGTLNGIDVLDVQRRNNRIEHFVKQKIEVGNEAIGCIDWKLRFDHMQNHTGEHIVSGLIHQKYGYENVGFHMGEVIQIDMDGPLCWEDLMEIETKANQVIYENVPVDITYPNEKTLQTLQYRSKKELKDTIRIVTIENVDVCACCGLHVNHTGEIGCIKILSCEKYKNGVRIEMLSGRKAMLYMQRQHVVNHTVSTLLSSKPLEIDSAVNTLQKKYDALYQNNRELLIQHFSQKVQTYPEGEEIVIDFEENIERTVLIHFANDLLVKKNIGVVIVCNHQQDSYSYIILSKKIDLTKYGKELNLRLHGKGGGKKEMIQGSFKANPKEIEKVLLETFSK